MDVTKLLEADHRVVEELFARIERAEGADRQPMIDELVTSLRAHMELEEQTVYPSMQPVTGEESVQEANTEHELARSAIDEMVRLARDEPGFGAALDAAKAGIAHHVDEEEHEVFPMLRSDGGSVLEETATAFMSKRVELGLPMPPEALVAASTKDELLAEAKSAGINGAASMSKDDLAAALADQMA